MDDPYINKPAPYISARERFSSGLKSTPEPRVDEEVSNIVHKKVFINDRKLINLVAKFKRKENPDSLEPSNLMQNPHFIEELRETFK